MDVVAALTGSVDASAYWRKLKQRLKEEGNETVTNGHSLKMLAADGKMRLTDVADTEQLFRRIQSTPPEKQNRFSAGWQKQAGSVSMKWTPRNRYRPANGNLSQDRIP